MVAKVKAPSYVAQHKTTRAKPAAKLKATVIEPPTQSSVHVDEPSWARVVVCFITQVAVGFGIGYIAAPLLEILAISTFIFTGSVALGMAMHLLSILVVAVVAWIAGDWVNTYILSGDIDRSYQKYSNVVRGWFSNSAMVTS